MKNRKIWIGFLVIALAVLVLYWMGNRSSANESAKPTYWVNGKKQDVEISTVLSGILTSSESINVLSPLSRESRTLITLIPEGSLVKKGDVIAQFDTAEIDEKIYDLEIDNGIDKRDEKKAEEDANVLDAEAAVENAKEKLKVAEINFQGLEFAAALDREKGTINLNKAKADVRIAENRLTRALTRRKYALKNAERYILTQARKLEQAKRVRDSFTMRSPSDGMIVYTVSHFGGTWRKVQNGDSLWKGQIFIEIPNLYEMEVEVEIPEGSIRKFALDQPAKVTLDAFPDIQYQASVAQINPLAIVKEGNPYVRVFKGRIRITDTDIERLRPGMNAKVLVVHNRYESAFSIPLTALAYHDDDGAYVYQLDEFSQLQKIKVTVVDQTFDHAILAEDLGDAKLVLINRAVEEAYRTGETSELRFVEMGN